MRGPGGPLPGSTQGPARWKIRAKTPGCKRCLHCTQAVANTRKQPRSRRRWLCQHPAEATGMQAGPGPPGCEFRPDVQEVPAARASGLNRGLTRGLFLLQAGPPGSRATAGPQARSSLVFQRCACLHGQTELGPGCSPPFPWIYTNTVEADSHHLLLVPPRTEAVNTK